MKYLQLCVLFVLNGCSPINENGITQNNSPVQGKIGLRHFDSLIIGADTVSSRGKNESAWFKLERNIDTTRLQLSIKGNLPHRLLYTTFDDGGVAGGTGAYYFNDSGICFAGKLWYDNFQIVELYFSDHRVISYRKEFDSINVLDLPPESNFYREALANKDVNDLMQFFNLTYKINKPAGNPHFYLRNYTGIQMFATADLSSEMVTKIAEKSRINFLYATTMRRSMRDTASVWYYVEFNGKRGWIKGDLDQIVEIDDENS